MASHNPKKPFAVMCRYRRMTRDCEFGDWKVWNKYPTGKQRDQALADVIKHSQSSIIKDIVEYCARDLNA